MTRALGVPLLLLVLLLPAGSRASVLTARPGLHASTISHGLRLEIAVPRGSYPQDALAPVTTTIRNISLHAVRLRKACDYGYLWVEVVDPRQQAVVYPPATPDAAPPTCSHAQAATMLQPGQSRKRSLVVLLRSSRIRVAVNLASGKVVGATTTVHLGPATPRPIVSPFTPGRYDFMTITPSGPVSGPLYSATYTNCNLGIASVETTAPTNRTVWTSGPARVVVPDSCQSDVYGLASWQFVAGWLGQSAVTWSDPDE